MSANNLLHISPKVEGAINAFLEKYYQSDEWTLLDLDIKSSHISKEDINLEFYTDYYVDSMLEKIGDEFTGLDFHLFWIC